MMRRILAFLAFVLVVTAAGAQKLDPQTQISWPGNCSASNFMAYNLASNSCVNVGPAGASGQVQFNAAGAWGVDAGFTYDPVAHMLTAPNLTVPGTSNVHIPPSGVQWPPSCSSGVYVPATNICVAPGTAGNPTGPTKAVQYNAGGTFGGVAGFAFDSSTGALSVPIIQSPGYTVATLPASPVTGMRVTVTDANSTCATGGGTKKVDCRWNGTSWDTMGGGVSTTGAATGIAIVADGVGGAMPSAGSIAANGPGSGAVGLPGATSGIAYISAPAIAGTTATLLMPVNDPAEGQTLYAHVPSSASCPPSANTATCVQLYWATLGNGVFPPSREAGCYYPITSGAATTISCAVSGLTGGEVLIVHTIRQSALTNIQMDGVTQPPLDTQTYSTNTVDRAVIANVGAGSHTITMNLNASSGFPGLMVDAFQNVPTSAVIDGPASWANLPTGSCTPQVIGTAVNVASAGEAVYAWSVLALGTSSAGNTFVLNFAPGQVNSEQTVPNNSGPFAASFATTGASNACGISTMVIKHK